jgi:hypothetical protein
MVDNVDQYLPFGQVMEAADFKITEWSPPGPMSLQYAQSDAKVRGMIGPLGSGKTTTMLVSEVFCAIRAPRCVDDVRRYRVLCTRDSYRQLYKTAIPSWQEYFPPTIGSWSGGQDRPAEHEIKFMDDYGPAEFKIEFAAIPDGSIRDWLDGYQVTSIIMNAINSHPREVYDFGVQRIDRFPARRKLKPGFVNDAHIGFDMNKEDVDHWCYEEFVLGFDPEFMLIKDFPSGLDPAAENAQNLPEDYYANIIRTLKSKPWLVKILVKNNWGASRSGQPVYPEYDDAKHLARGIDGHPTDIDADPGLELCIGLDAGTATGGRPSAVFFQVAAPFQLRVIDELYLGRCGPNRFFDALLAKLDEPHLRPAASDLRVWVDPSAFYGHDEESDEETWIDVGEAKLDVDFEEPESNELEGFRLETIRVCLNGHEGSQWMLVLSKRCKMLRRGFNSGYRYKRHEKRGETREDPKPDKNDESHPHDALQHGATGYFGRSLVTNTGRALGGRSGPKNFGGLLTGDFDVFS